MYPRIDPAPHAIPEDPEVAMASLGIERVPVDYFHWSGFRYTNLKDALAAARRAPHAGGPDA